MGSYSRQPRLLFIDAFDSFTNNVVGLLEKSIGANVTVVRINNDEFAKDIEFHLSAFDAVVVGPGPGDPAKPEDIGFINKLWSLPYELTLPVLGVCLGHQSLCLNNGARVVRLSEPRHGIVSDMVHCEKDIFEGVGSLSATQYHSFQVDLGDGNGIFWTPTSSCPTLLPLAWGPADVGGKPVLEAVRHTEKPFWSVQFHPESICTSRVGAERLVANWWALAWQWNESRGRQVNTLQWQDSAAPLDSCANVHDNEHTTVVAEILSVTGYSSETTLSWKTFPARKLAPDALCETLKPHMGDEVDFVLLDSQGHKGSRGRFSIVGLVDPQHTLTITYSVNDRCLCWGADGTKGRFQLESIDQVWPILQRVLDAHCPSNSGSLPTETPFWGGFTGYISYEAGLETIQVDVHRPSDIPDINFAFIQRSIVIDHTKDLVYIQSLLPNDEVWIANTVEVLAQRNAGCGTPPPEEDFSLSKTLNCTKVSKPAENVYRGNVLKCQEFLRSGDSYELCLTDQTEITIPNDGNSISHWRLYKHLRQKNPAPFGAFLRLNGVTVVGSSPERFLSWDRAGRCQFRPIKGTVKKSDYSREEAYEILESSKERAENLMIVDLIRHDVSGVVGASNTWVSKLMVVEEYATVYQLVSVIESQCPSADERRSTRAKGVHVPGGLDVLRASLPPGSMTGAPKKRSCEILRDLEPRNRGVYSGVLGYLDVGGGGDFSVVIRTAVSVSDKASSSSNESTNSSESYTYRIGAGGAVTIQSTDEGEFQEMETKLSSVLRAFTA